LLCFVRSEYTLSPVYNHNRFITVAAYTRPSSLLPADLRSFSISSAVFASASIRAAPGH
jgi:hypothetical protein